MPTCNVYLSADEYAQLVYISIAQKIRVPLLIRKIVQEHLKEKGEKLGQRTS